MIRLLLFLTLTLRLAAQETMIREVFDPATDTHVEIIALFTKLSPGGYLPVRVKIANNLNKEQNIRVGFKSNSDYNDELRSESSFNFTAGPGKAVTRDIMVPISANVGGSSRRTSVTAKLSGSLGISEHSIRSGSYPTQPAVLLSEALFTPHASSLDNLVNKSYGNSEFAGKFDPKQLPDDWLAYSGYDSMVMMDSDWTNIPPAGRNAILSWVRLGGQLNIYAESESITRKSLALPEQACYGNISISYSTPASQSVNRIMPGGEIISRTMSGSISPERIMDDVTENSSLTKQDSITKDFSGIWPLQSDFGQQKFRYGLFVGVLVVFAILVGPVNLFVFAKAGQRHRLFITTPIISLAASLLLIGLIVVQDGFGGSGIRRVLMEVRPDEGLNAAFVHQEQFCRTGVLTGSNFSVATPVALSPVPITQSRWARFTNGGGAKGVFNLQPADGKMEASGDWFQSRSEHGHILSAVVATRGRIEKADAPDTFVSTFEFPIEVIYFLDASSQWQQATNIEAGKKFTLKPVEKAIADKELQKAANSLSQRNRDTLQAAMTRPGHFIALTSHAPGIDTHPSIRWRKTQTAITGPVM